MFRYQRRQMLWERSSDVCTQAISNAVSRNRFGEFSRYLRVCDNNNLIPGDKFTKVHNLWAMIIERWLLYFPHTSHLSIDASIIAYYGWHSCKQYIRDKPIKFDYKLDVSTHHPVIPCASSYLGAQKEYDIPSLALGGSVIVDLISELPSHIEYKLYFDNFFTTLYLLDYLAEKIAGNSTLQANRTDGTHLKDSKPLQKQPRCSFDYITDINPGTIMVIWNDDKLVIISSNCHGLEPIHKANRWSNLKQTCGHTTAESGFPIKTVRWWCWLYGPKYGELFDFNPN